MTDPINNASTMYPAMTLSASSTESNTAAASASAYGPVSADDKASFLEAMANAWGKQLDKQAASMQRLSDNLINDDGANMNLNIALLTAESEDLKALSTSASTATNSVAEALQTLSRKQ